MLFLLSLSYLLSQTPDTAILRGQAVDARNALLPGVEIIVFNTRTGLRRTAQTGLDGRFAIAGLSIAGTYRIDVSAPGFVTQHLNGITLEGGATATVSLKMTVSGGKTETVVTGVVGELRADQPQLGDRLGSLTMEQIPILGRKITFLPLLNAANRPAINQGDIFMNQFLFTTNGAGRRQTWFEVDGSTGNDSWGRQTIFTSIPLAAVEEMTVLENAFAANYGFGSGSVVNVVTKSGGQQFHGQALALWRPSGPEAKLSGFTAGNATSGDDVTNDTLDQGALTLSGPLGYRTAFLASGEYSAQDRASPVTSPVAPGNFIGHYRDWMGFLRMDHPINRGNSLFLRANLDRFYDTNPNGAVGGETLPSAGRIFRRRTYSAELGETAALSPWLLNYLRLQFQLASPITEFDPLINGTQYQVPISTGGTYISGTSQSALLMNRQYEIHDALSATRGRHQIQLGEDVITAHNGGDSKEYGGPIYDGQFLYKTCTQALSFCESPAYLENINNVQTYTQSYGNASYTVDDTLWALYFQDDYKLWPSLTLNLGVRYERQTFTDSRTNVAPRVGFAYDVQGAGRGVLRGGFGIYYSQVPDNSQANYTLTGPTGVFNYTAAPGQIGFPAAIQAAPLPAFPAGAPVPLRSLYIRPGRSSYYDQFFPTATLLGYPDQPQNPYSEQWTFGVESRLANQWVLSMDYLGSHTLKIVRPLDLDTPASFVRTAQGQTRSAQAANCTRPYWVEWYAQHGTACNSNAAMNPQPPYSVIQSDVNDGYSYYEALNIDLKHRFYKGSSLLASYTWSHAIDNVDPDVPSQNPNDARSTGHAEIGSAIFDQRHRLVLSGVYTAPFGIEAGGVASLASGTPFNVVTGTNNSGDSGATTDRPIIQDTVIGRNTGQGTPTFDISPFLARSIALWTGRVHLDLRAEAFNVLNYRNAVGFSGTYGNGATAGAGFGQPLTGVANQLPARMLQFSGSVNF